MQHSASLLFKKGLFLSVCYFTTYYKHFVNNQWTFAIEPEVYMRLHHNIGFQSLAKQVTWIGTRNVLTMRVTY